ncbi:DUF317 domain-containing protein [Streptomyces sp. PB17]|uniref:DUF317 domain-containing protein n=1 Tax=Streptomyces sp. PB17 TaxID=3384158 RepID=UPI0038B43B64
MTPAIDAYVRLDTHPTHLSAVQAHLTGSQAHVASTALEAANWTVAATGVLILARIDHEEPYWAADAAQNLITEGITVEITPRLQEAIYEEWTWANYPMPWLTRSEIREVSSEAQKIHDDILNGHLLIHAHAHAHDGHTTVAVGTYLHRGGKSVYLHGEDHLRQVAGTFDSPASALLAFEETHADGMRPGPAPLTDTERAAIAARSVFDVTASKPDPARPEPETVPVYLADAGDHDALLDAFLDKHREFEKWRTWSDDTTHAIHESQTLRIERVHKAPAHETAWTVAAYETPVSERMWVLTATGATPAPVLQCLLIHLADGNGGDTAISASADEKMVTAATQPLSDVGWKHAEDGRWIRWTSPTGTPASSSTPSPHNTRVRTCWTIWAGPDSNRPTSAITASPHTPSPLLAELSETLAHETGTRQTQPGREHRTGPACDRAHARADPAHHPPPRWVVRVKARPLVAEPAPLDEDGSTASERRIRVR